MINGMIFLGLPAAMAQLRVNESTLQLNNNWQQTEIINLTNQQRRLMQINGLVKSQVLTASAQAKADSMATQGYFSHNGPDGKTPWQWMMEKGYKPVWGGENLAVSNESMRVVVNEWMKSSTHKKNIANKNFTEIGVGISQGMYQGKEMTFVVQMFGLPAEGL
jgi:uncharacterized protein YkwD